MTGDEIRMAIAFARLELLELEHGRRGITQCPGIEQLAKEAERTRKVWAEEGRRTNDERGRPL